MQTDVTQPANGPRPDPPLGAGISLLGQNAAMSDDDLQPFPDDWQRALAVVEYGLPLRRDIARAIRRHSPDLLITGNAHPSWPGGWPNMADHRVVGQAVIDAARNAANRWVFTDLIDEGFEPWSGARRIAMNASPQATHAVDITHTIERGVASLRAHAVYLAGLANSDMDPDAFLRDWAEQAATRFGRRLAVTFELLEW